MACKLVQRYVFFSLGFVDTALYVKKVNSKDLVKAQGTIVSTLPIIKKTMKRNTYVYV